MPADEPPPDVSDPQRLAALRAVALLDTPTEEAFDRLTRLATRFVDAPVALVSLVDADRQFFKSCVGLSEPWASRRQTPLSHSFCQHNLTAGRPLVINDARQHPLVRGNPAIRDLSVIAYLGIPLATSDGYVLGSFCVIDSRPRQWSEGDVAVVQDLAAAVMTEIQLRTEIGARNRIEGERDDLAELNRLLRSEIAAREKAEERQREAEAELRQAQKMEAIGRLAGGLAHDLNNLLTPLLGYGELLSGGQGLGEENREYLREILRAGSRARDLVQRLLAFSRKHIIELRALDINGTIGGFSNLLRHIAPEDIEIVVDLSADIRPVMADEGQFEQIIMNLAVNAIDAMPDGGRLKIETALAELDEEAEGTSAAQPELHVVLTVSDTGCGMDRETLEHIFEPFFSTKGEQGTGLGLATVFGILEQQGGTVRVSSEPDAGTTFRIYLPVADTEAVEKEAGRSAASDLKGTETVLLVEDSAAVQRWARAILLQQGYTVLSASDGEVALTLLRSDEGEVDLLLTDLVLPGMNGRELYEKALEERPNLKVLFMSGYADDVIRDRGILDDAGGFIQKPFSAADLAYRIREVLEE